MRKWICTCPILNNPRIDCYLAILYVIQYSHAIHSTMLYMERQASHLRLREAKSALVCIGEHSKQNAVLFTLICIHATTFERQNGITPTAMMLLFITLLPFLRLDTHTQATKTNDECVAHLFWRIYLNS